MWLQKNLRVGLMEEVVHSGGLAFQGCGRRNDKMLQVWDCVV